MRFSPGFCRGLSRSTDVFISRHETKSFHPNTFYSFLFMMANEEHSYAIPDSTVTSLRLLCGPDFTFDVPAAVPFHITEMAPVSPTDTGRTTLQTLFFPTVAQRRELLDLFCLHSRWQNLWTQNWALSLLTSPRRPRTPSRRRHRQRSAARSLGLLLHLNRTWWVLLRDLCGCTRPHRR